MNEKRLFETFFPSTQQNCHWHLYTITQFIVYATQWVWCKKKKRLPVLSMALVIRDWFLQFKVFLKAG